jgi:hypothetical protein
MEAVAEHQRGSEYDDSQRDTENGRTNRHAAPADSGVDREADAHDGRSGEARRGCDTGDAWSS